MNLAVDAFAGAGGLSLGLQGAGWDVVFAFDNDPVAVETYRRNLGLPAEVLDAELLEPGELMTRAGLKPGDCALLAGGPPCQGFSLQRRGVRDDPRNRLVLRFLDYIAGLQPRAFLMENVPAIATVRGRALLEAIVDRTGEAGYSVYIRTLDAADYGVAQHRKRTFLIGLVADAGPFVWPEPTISGAPLTVAEALEGLPSPPQDGSPHPEVPNHYREARLSATNIERIRHVPPGGGREHLPPELRLKCHENGHRHLDTYGRLAWDRPSGTITARFDSFTRGRFGHPVEDRSITLREGARLQGFPDWFIFEGNREDGARLIGNAVPPPLARALGRATRQALEGAPEQPVPGGPPSARAVPTTAQARLEL
jgi:DNA (cytosine-5)-methyltransferase 1